MKKLTEKSDTFQKTLPVRLTDAERELAHDERRLVLMQNRVKTSKARLDELLKLKEAGDVAPK